MFLKTWNIFETIKIVEFFFIYMGKMVRARPGAGAGNFWQAGAGARAGAAPKWTGSATLVKRKAVTHILDVVLLGNENLG
jgi:hypothetical protein